MKLGEKEISISRILIKGKNKEKISQVNLRHLMCRLELIMNINLILIKLTMILPGIALITANKRKLN
jgi:hypothetical protein